MSLVSFTVNARDADMLEELGFERTQVLKALRECEGDSQRAAALLAERSTDSAAVSAPPGTVIEIPPATAPPFLVPVPPQVVPVTFSWNCAVCGGANIEASSACRHCGSPESITATNTLTWACGLCTCDNPISNVRCDACDNPRPGYTPPPEPEPELPTRPGVWSCEVCTMRNTDPNAPCVACDAISPFAQRDLPSHWAPMGRALTREVELMGRPEHDEELRRVIRDFTAGRDVPVQRFTSVRRVQNPALWRCYTAQRDLVKAKPTNNGDPNEMFLFHGSRGNCDNIIANGFVSQYANSCPYGIWFSSQASYSGGGFATVNPDGTRQVFLSRVTVGTTGTDDGTGRRPGVVPGTSHLADCHHSGTIYVVYQDRQAYPEYIIQWLPDNAAPVVRPGRPPRRPRPRGRKRG